MFDTVSLGYKFTMSSGQLKDFYLRTYYDPFEHKTTRKYWKRFSLSDEDSCLLQYYPQDPTGMPDPILLIEFSIPRFIYGTNIPMACDHQQIIDVSNELFRSLSGYPLVLPRIKVEIGMVKRIDLLFNHQVGENVEAYHKAFSKLSYPHRETIGYEGGVQYYAKSISTKFYDKYNETKKNQEAYGIWRQETTIRRGADLKEFTGKEYPTILDFPMPLVEKLLNKDLERLEIDKQVICPEDVAMELLSKAYKPNIADRCLGFLIRNQGRTKKELASSYGKTTHSINNNIKAITDAGVSMALSENKKTLPKLIVDYLPQQTCSRN